MEISKLILVLTGRDITYVSELKYLGVLIVDAYAICLWTEWHKIWTEISRYWPTLGHRFHIGLISGLKGARNFSYILAPIVPGIALFSDH